MVAAWDHDLSAEGMEKGSSRGGENPCELAVGVPVGCTDRVVMTAVSKSVGPSAWSESPS